MLIHLDSRSLLLRTSRPQMVSDLLPGLTREVDYQGHNLAVAHRMDTTWVMRNLGIEAPSPILHYYDWPKLRGEFSPMVHQMATAEFCTLHRKGFVLNQMGTGKTASAIWAADYLIREGYIKKVLVITPLSTVELVWAREIVSVTPHNSRVVLTGTKVNRLKKLDGGARFDIINYDGVEVIADALVQAKYDLVIVDEASAYTNGRTTRYKVLKALLAHNPMLWLLTGTPCAQAPTQAFALAQLVNPKLVPKSFTQWRQETMVKVSDYKWVPRHDAAAKVYAALQPAILVRKEDCIDLPPLTTIYSQCELSDEQTKALKLMLNKGKSELRAGEVTAVNAADRMNKLRQIMCGSVKDMELGDDAYQELDYNPRFSVLLENIERAEGKVIIIVPFKGILRSLTARLNKHFENDGKHFGMLNGDVTDRVSVVDDFKDNPDCMGLICHPKVMSHGLTLTEADVMIFYAPIDSAEQYLQVVERINRPGQKRRMTVIRMCAHHIEQRRYENLDANADQQASVFDLFIEAVND